jgi:hypothetical protein
VGVGAGADAGVVEQGACGADCAVVCCACAAQARQGAADAGGADGVLVQAVGALRYALVRQIHHIIPSLTSLTSECRIFTSQAPSETLHTINPNTHISHRTLQIAYTPKQIIPPYTRHTAHIRSTVATRLSAPCTLKRRPIGICGIRAGRDASVTREVEGWDCGDAGSAG